MAITVGEVIGVRGVNIILKIFDESSKDIIYFQGKKFKGVSIREHVIIQRGFTDIACIVEGEYLDENRFENDSEKITYIRKVEVKPIGYFKEGQFFEGIKYLPMIKDSVFLISEEQVSKIYHSEDTDHKLVIGKMLKENILVSLPWERLFNTHIGIFGNTGSGKSNTLTKLYTTLFDLKSAHMQGRSQFILIDFNGEYTNDQLVEKKDKTVYNLSTRDINPGVDNRFPMEADDLLNTEVLSLLFKATLNTQRPFLDRVITGWKKYINNEESIERYTKSTFKRVFTAQAQKKETKDLLINVAKIIGNESIEESLNSISWHGKDGHFYIERTNHHFNGDESSYEGSQIKSLVDEIKIDELSFFQELILRVHLKLANDLIYGFFQFEHIQPLLKRIESSVKELEKVLKVGERDINDKILTIISFRRCNQNVKKILPLLLAKYFYESHKDEVNTPPNTTLHIIIDEAHNILSMQSIREQESWKDYRLELFEEIIKEGRKFGVFLTLASQRPADISATIMSQLHNFFIHRLVNDKDLFLLDNTISTLDSLSKGMIPSLAKGCCIITGTSFDLPMVVQVDRLDRKYQPDSDDVNLEDIWKE